MALRLDLPDDGGAPGPATRAFEPEPSWALLAGATVAVVQSDDYRIDLLTLDGSPKGTLVRPLPERPVTERDREAFRRGLREQYERLLGSATGAPSLVTGRLTVEVTPRSPPTRLRPTKGVS